LRDSRAFSIANRIGSEYGELAQMRLLPIATLVQPGKKFLGGKPGRNWHFLGGRGLPWAGIRVSGINPMPHGSAQGHQEHCYRGCNC
jgi:hypothetical protein